MKIYTYAIYEDNEYESPDPSFYWSTEEHSESELRKIAFDVSAFFGASVEPHDPKYRHELARIMAEHGLYRFVPQGVPIDPRAFRGYFPFHSEIWRLPEPIITEDEPPTNS